MYPTLTYQWGIFRTNSRLDLPAKTQHVHRPVLCLWRCRHPAYEQWGRSRNPMRITGLVRTQSQPAGPSGQSIQTQPLPTAYAACNSSPSGCKISLIRVSPLAVCTETASYAVAIFRRSVARPTVNKNPLSPEGSRIMRITNSPDQRNKGKADCIHRLISTTRASAVAERKFFQIAFSGMEWRHEARAPMPLEDCAIQRRAARALYF